MADAQLRDISSAPSNQHQPAVWTFGLNNRGQIGDNSTTTRSTPVQVTGLTDVMAVAAGTYHTMAPQAAVVTRRDAWLVGARLRTAASR